MAVLIKGGRVIDPGHLDDIKDILIDGGQIVALADPGTLIDTGQVISAQGLIVTPGLIDVHVHLREPGHEYKETIASGCQAAAAGGFTAVAAMPNTLPVNDSAQITRFILEKAAQAGAANVFPVAAISRGLAGRIR